MPRNIKFIFVGKLKANFWQEAQTHYVKRLKPYIRIRETLIKDAPSSLGSDERTRLEGQKILHAIEEQDYVICLDQHGIVLDSPGLAKRLEPMLEDANLSPCFIIGGAYGLWLPVKNRAQMVLSLGSMTFPHELARIILFEQIYRAVAILRGLPYHHE